MVPLLTSARPTCSCSCDTSLAPFTLDDFIARGDRGLMLACLRPHCALPVQRGSNLRSQLFHVSGAVALNHFVEGPQMPRCGYQAVPVQILC